MVKGAIKTCHVLIILALFVSVFPLIPARTFAQSRKIVVLESANLAPYNTALKGIKEILGDNLSVYDMEGDSEKGKRLVDQFVSNGSNAVLAVGLPAAEVAANEQSAIPVIFSMVLYSEKSLVSRPNVTGVFMDVPVHDQIQALKEALPKLERIGVIYNPANTGGLVEEASSVASSLNLKLVPVSVSSPDDVPEALRRILPLIDCLWMVPDKTVFTADSFDYINEATFEKRIPFLVFSWEFVEAGGLLALSPDYVEVGRESGRMALKVLSGTPPSRISPRFSGKYELVINQNTASQIGVKFPPSILARARIIQ